MEWFIKEIKYFVTENGNSPFEDWFEKLDKITKVIIIRTLQKVIRGGAKKSIKALKNSIFEIKISYGRGYRVYFAEDKETLMILAGGDKKTQTRDIEKAKKFWRSYGKQT